MCIYMVELFFPDRDPPFKQQKYKVSITSIEALIWS